MQPNNQLIHWPLKPLGTSLDFKWRDGKDEGSWGDGKLLILYKYSDIYCLLGAPVLLKIVYMAPLLLNNVFSAPLLLKIVH